MSKSLKRVKLALADAGVGAEILEMPNETRTAADAAREANCHIDQIAKSIIFRGEESDRLFLFITSGGRRVSSEKATDLVGETLGRADAAYVRMVTGFAIGGIAPIAHLTSPRAFWDPRLSEFNTVYAAAGTPNHIFAIDPTELINISQAQLADFTDEICKM
ncbi:MAG: YbaK/EbsC family protein [Boseongicola sp.]